MRSIDADALDTKAFGSEHPYFFDGDDVAKWYKECIKTAPTIEPPANWTPCSAGLPDIGEEVDVTYQINGKREVGYGKYIGNEQWIAKYGYGHDDEDGEVLAWRPLSEPYRGEA